MLQASDPKKTDLARHAIHQANKARKQQKSLAYMIKNNIIGTADKAKIQMLANPAKKEVNVWQQIGAEEPSKAAQSVMKQSDDAGYK
eukprot:711169-Hanusia_phi.AAC.1